MPQFRKKPVVIEAEQYSKERHIREGYLPDGVERVFITGEEGEQYEGKPCIETLEGRLYVSDGDWIITGVNGERYPCKPDIFEATYEPAERVDGARTGSETLSAVRDEAMRAPQKFPANNHRLAALMEEVGELAEALLIAESENHVLDYLEDVRHEAIQVAAMAVRIIEEGDHDFGYNYLEFEADGVNLNSERTQF